MNRRAELLRLLGDGGLHSGEVLARALDCSRAAVWKQLRRFADRGIEIEAIPGRGYRLPVPVDLLDAGAIRKALPHWSRERLRRLEVHEELASTSDRLLETTDLPAGRFDACLAEVQTAGRGRRGRRWFAPFGSGLCLSLSWSWRDPPAALPALSLAAGVAALRALGRLKLAGFSLKWPNDIVHGDSKLGGILIDLRSEAGGPAFVVVGIGINVRLPEALIGQLHAEGQKVTDLSRVAGEAPSRNALAAALVNELALALEEFGLRGLAAFADEWRAADALQDRAVQVSQGEQRFDGLARGVDDDGALIVDVAGAKRRLLSGEVSVRAAR